MKSVIFFWNFAHQTQFERFLSFIIFLFWTYLLLVYINPLKAKLSKIFENFEKIGFKLNRTISSHANWLFPGKMGKVLDQIRKINTNYCILSLFCTNLIKTKLLKFILAILQIALKKLLYGSTELNWRILLRICSNKCHTSISYENKITKKLISAHLPIGKSILKMLKS